MDQVIDAAAPRDPRVPVLDDVAALLSPAALRARMRQVPPYHPRRGPLGRRIMGHLKVYKGATHPHEAQQPTPLDVAAINRKNKRA